jgi:anti-sigma regulatory factor (Ser/Thr protein kinase)
VSLADVARAAVSEIEQYDRVVLNIQPGIGVTGNAVADVVHLLAEVIENATTFSAKGTQVTVSGHSLRSGGVLINVIDSGMGMLEEQLRQVNWRLENPPAADIEVSRHMGLFAVAHLAARHGIRVRLRTGARGGLIAHVWLPSTVISRDIGSGPMDGIHTARASAVVQAVTRTAKSPRDPAAAAPPTEQRFAAAPLAETPVAAASLAEEPPAGAPPAEVPLVVVPEAAQSTPEARLPIFESVESDWFHGCRQPPPPVTPPAVTPRQTALARKSPSDDAWRAAETILTPAVGGVTAAGLPRRIPRANLVPGSAGNQEDRPAGPAEPAEVVSSRLADFQRGSRRARAAPPSARPPDE